MIFIVGVNFCYQMEWLHGAIHKDYILVVHLWAGVEMLNNIAIAKIVLISETVNNYIS